MKHLFTMVLILLAGVTVQAQTGIFKGRILDEANLPLIGATVVVGEARGTTSDIDGFFSLSGLEEGSHDVEVTYMGYETKNFTLDITAGATEVMTITLQPGVELAEVVVTSQLMGQARALNKQLANDNITNVIAADQIGRFPDANIGDAMKRIPGINVQYDQGEARFGNIRGTSPQLSSVMVNGERIPSAEAEIRSVQLDLVPSDMVAAVEVNKAVTPDMDADAIGGAVNLVTRAAPAEQRISATFGGGYNLVAEKPSFNLGFIYGNRFAEDKLGLIFSASVFDNQIGSDNVEAEWDFDDANENDTEDAGEMVWPSEIQTRQYYLERLRQSYSLSLDYRLGKNHTIDFRGMYNRRKDWENRYRAVYKDIEENGGVWVAEMERQTKGGTSNQKYSRLEDQDMMSYSLGGDHLFGKLNMDWSLNFSRASEERPNERYFEYATADVEVVALDLSDTEKPKIVAASPDFQKPTDRWEIKEMTEEFQSTYDQDFNTRLDFDLPIKMGKFTNNLEFGFRSRSKTKERDNDFYEFSAVDEDAALAGSLGNLRDISKSNYLAGDYMLGEFVNEEYLGDLDFDNGALFEKERILEELAGNFSATENILGGYLMLRQKVTHDFSFIVGVRLENTSNKYKGFRFDAEEETLNATKEVTNSYVNVMPGLHLKYTLGKKTVLRAAYTSTLARPNYFDLVPYRVIEDNVELSIGNPALKPSTANNFDFMAEHYFGSVGIVSAGVFYKKIDDVIVTQTLNDYAFEGNTWDSYSTPINSGNADLFGFEMAFQRQLVKGLGLYMNYTFTSSKINDFNVEGREDESLSLPGSPQHTLNLSLSYEVAGLTSRVSFNYASDFIDEFGDSKFFDRYYDKVTYLDVNLGYSINDNWTVYLNANNLLNQPLRYFQGTSGRTMQAEYYNARFDLGVKFDLFGKRSKDEE